MKDETKSVGVFHCKLIRDGKVIDEWSSKNTATYQGLAYMNTIAFQRGPGTPTAKSSWYIGIYEGSVTTSTLKGTTAATVASDVTEIADTNYDETGRLAWTVDNASGTDSSDVTITNTSTPTQFTMSATKTVRGAFLCSESTSGGTSAADYCFSISNFSTARNTESGDILQIVYESTLTS